MHFRLPAHTAALLSTAIVLTSTAVAAGPVSATTEASPPAANSAGLRVTTVANPYPQLISGSSTLIRVSGAQADPAGLRVTTVANPYPQLISGSSTLIRVSGAQADPAGLRVSVNGKDATAGFRRQPDGSWLGLIGGLRPGTATVEARDGRASTRLQLVDHPITGPVFSGPQQHPYFCETTAFGLAPATQPDSSAPTKVSYLYMNRAGAFTALPDPATRPADLATAHVAGRAVPYIVRLETGTIDRAVYQIAALYDGAEPDPPRPDASWNGKLVYSFGGGCNGGYHQGDVTGGVLDDLMLSQGYAVASSTLNVLDQNCSAMLSAEAAMMVKEHFIDTYGPVVYTIGWGGSGGAIQQYDIADAYPGILNGIVPGVSFTDPLSVGEIAGDCRLLDRFFATPAGSSFTPGQRQAVSGFANNDTCTSWDNSFADRLTPTDSCNGQIVAPDDAIPASAEWNPVTNPRGVACSLQQQLGNQLGINPATGLAPVPYDNTGVQYGLSALEDGTITPAQFLALNQAIGGYDRLGQPAAARSSAQAGTLATAYRDDIVLSGGQGLATTPIIDQRTDLDQAGVLNDIHTTGWSLAVRARLIAANGTAANQVIIEDQPIAAAMAAADTYELAAMDQWLANITADTGTRTPAQKTITDKPAGLGDGCYLAGQRVVAPVTDPATGPCAATYPTAANPRAVAGEPVAANVLKCRLEPVRPSDYPVSFAPAQKRELRSTFPNGICDYQLPGIAQGPPMGDWLSYGDGTGAAFGQAPAPWPLTAPKL
jgi:hypothetical protein